MPKSTFLNISEEKQKRILDAAEREFLSVPYSQISINKIVKNAGIPRGSFYQYFDGIDDLFMCVLDKYKNLLFEKLLNELEKTGGDIFACIENHVDSLMEHIYEEDGGEFKMLISEPHVMEMLTKVIMQKEGCEGKISDEIMSRFDRSNLDIENDEEMLLLIDIICMVVRGNIGRTFITHSKYEKEQAKALFHAQISTLKKHYSK